VNKGIDEDVTGILVLILVLEIGKRFQKNPSPPFEGEDLARMGKMYHNV